jgi:putative PIN family toxin of toxin-antitoxin system
MIRVVIDANVFVSAILKPKSKPDKIIDLIKQGKLALALSHDILAEIRKVLLYPKIKKKLRLTTKEIGESLIQIGQAAITTQGKVRVNVIKDDPDDNRYLECAMEAQADFIISGDRHLKDLKSFQGIKIVDPATFLEFIAELDEE